jgi:DNA polymerase elongation subunit (family B)
LGFKNARFGKIDAHIATCAFSREVLRKAVAIVESRGFKLIHGIVDSMWLKKPNASDAEYKELCTQIEKELGLPISFEGRYKWIVFLNSRINPKLPVLNMYYGVFENGALKVRGIDLRRHDTPEVIRKCQSDMLTVLSQAEDSQEFKKLIPKTLAIVKSYISALRTRKVPIEQLVVEKRLSKDTSEYTNLIPQAIAAAHLSREGQDIHAGQTVSYVVTNNESRIAGNRALPAEFLTESTCYDSEWYVNLILSSVANLFLPFGYDVKSLRDWSNLF